MKADFSRTKKNSHKSPPPTRLKIILVVMYGLFFLVGIRLFYWQIIKGSRLKVEATEQYEKLIVNTGLRGSIYTSDDYLLVGNRKVYKLFSQPHLYTNSSDKIMDSIGGLLLQTNDDYYQASESAIKDEIKSNFFKFLEEKLSVSDKKWVGILSGIDEKTKDEIENLKIDGLGFEPYFERYYPEASMAAQLTGFVGQDEDGQPQGYFGIEGALNKELSARTNSELKTSFSFLDEQQKINGRDIKITIRRDIQHLAETELKRALEKYDAKSGEVIIMEPQTGKILAIANLPSYDQKEFFKFPGELYRNPSFSSFYEPGSTFKVVTVAAGIDSGAIKPETICDRCSGPRKIGKYTIRTWNDEYNPDITMTDALAKSDNTAMIFAQEEMGSDTFVKYVRSFGFGEKVTNDIQEDSSPPFPDKWGPIELATRSFGQGISASSMQMVRAVNVIANDGILVQPQIIEEVLDLQTGEVIESQVVNLDQVISKETAKEVTKMMIESANHGEAQWIATDQYLVAGKTGTSQIPDETGGYHEDKTIASFIGFAPADNPKFIMLTKLTQPQSSIWAAETAAPLWYRIADRLILLLNLPS